MQCVMTALCITPCCLLCHCVHPYLYWQAAAENLELRGRVKSDPSAINSSTCHHNAVQAASQVMPPQLNGSDSKPTYAQ